MERFRKGAIRNEPEVRENISRVSSMLREMNDDDFLEAAINPKKIHLDLFRYLEGEVQGIGEYRDKGMTVRYLSEGKVLSLARLAEPEDIARLMTLWGEYLTSIVKAKPEPEIAVGVLAQAIHYFFEAHPFVDGNGRTLRIIVKELCIRCGYPISDKWTIAERPYDRHFRYALRHYRTNPALLYGGLRAFICPIAISVDAEVTRYWGSSRDCGCDQEDLFEKNSCLTKCAMDGGGGGGGGDDGDDGQSFMDWVTSILDQT